VVIPAYNRASALGAALASVAAQSLRPDEVVVLDGASTDRTVTMAKEWGPLLPLVLVERRVNEGPGVARRVAIEHSRGSLIALLDADSYCLPDHLAVMATTWERTGGVVVAEEVEALPGRRLCRPGWAERFPMPPRERQDQQPLSGSCRVYCSLFSRVDYDAVCGIESLRTGEDWDLWIRLVRGGIRMSVASTPTVVYRNRPESLPASRSRVAGDIAVLEALVEQLGPTEQPLARRALRLLRARRDFLAAFDDVAAGSVGRARWHWVRAAAGDRELGRHGGPYPSVALRSLAYSIAPRWAAGTTTQGEGG